MKDRPTYAADVMSCPVLALHVKSTTEESMEILADHSFTGAPVVDASQKLVGIVSDRDIAHALGSPRVRRALRRSTAPALLNVRRFGTQVRDLTDVMTRAPFTVHADTPITAVAELMFKEDINRLPVVRNDVLIGIVTRRDLLASMAGLNRSHRPADEKAVVAGSGLSAGRPSSGGNEDALKWRDPFLEA